jgi:hypothetical protein
MAGNAGLENLWRVSDMEVSKFGWGFLYTKNENCTGIV